VVIGDNGEVNFTNTGLITDATTTVPGTGGNDQILTGDGDDVVLGGAGTDYINTDLTGAPVGSDTGDDIMVGDNGLAMFDTSSGESVLTNIETTDSAYGSDDFIFGDGGSDVILGGKGNDTLIAGAGNDTVLGDNGEIIYTEGLISQIISSDISVDTAGDDTILAGEGDDMVIGGIGNDILDGADGNDILIGDSGQITLEDGLLVKVTSIPIDEGGDDSISGGNGVDILIGGLFNDNLLGGSDFDILFGDNGVVIFSEGEHWIAETIPSNGGGVDYLDGGEDTDVLFGGEGNDAGVGEFPEDALIGEFGQVIIEHYKIIGIYPPINMMFGSPVYESDGHTVSKMEDTGPVMTRNIIFMETATGFTAIIEEGLSGFNRIVTGHASYGQSYGSGLIEREALYAGAGRSAVRLQGEQVTEITLQDGSIERRFSDGSVETTSPDGTVTTRLADGTVIIVRADGTMITTSPDGTKTATLPNGTIIKTLPDGTIITTLPDGRVIRTLSEGTTEIIAESDAVSGNTNIKETRYSDLGMPDQGTEGFRNGSVNIIDSSIKLGSLVAGLRGWGLAGSFGSQSNQHILDLEGFKKLDHNTKSRRFRKWREGRFVRLGWGDGPIPDRSKMH
jgi:Ca2+-binding RTX toxin-like protein